ncbi:MAG TPA: pilus assembly PilX N-terminal domain-containing protein [Anaerolineae bacterium]|nr:pilus assembly PilX N-terminal domain-containing protein [Anaerolineae bacterium]
MGLIYKNEKGMVLPLGLMFLAIIAILGTTAVIVTTTDLKIGSNYRASEQAFYDADAGVQYVIASIKDGLENETFALPANIEDTVSFTSYYTTPADFSFTISDISMTDSNTYTFTSTGSGPGNSQSVIEVSFAREVTSAINYAGFGDAKLDTKNGGTTLSYDSSSPDPTKNDPSNPSFQSTHEADVGSNDWLVTHNGVLIDGSGVFGEQSDGSPTTDGIHGGTTFYETTPVNAGRIDPDPLGVNSGGIYDPSTYSVSNDNDLSGVGTTINTSGPVTLVGKAGGANYYFTDITLKVGSSLTVDVTAGPPVNIFLEGGLEAKNGSTINVVGNATDFAIFSNSASKIDFKHNSEFKGLVYAPFAPVDMKNSSSVYGAIWAKTLDIKNSGTLYFDTALKNKYSNTTNNMLIQSWKEVF